MVCNLLRNNYWRIQNTNCFLHKAATTHAARKLRLVIKEGCLARRAADIRCTRHLPSRTAILDPGKPYRRALRQESWERFVGVEITPSGIAGALQRPAVTSCGVEFPVSLHLPVFTALGWPVSPGGCCGRHSVTSEAPDLLASGPTVWGGGEAGCHTVRTWNQRCRPHMSA